MQKKIISTVLAISFSFALFSVFTGCTVRTEKMNPYDSVYIINPYERLTATSECEITGWDTLKITLAKNEAEGGQLLVRSAEKEYKNMRISISPLKKENGVLLGVDSLEIFREEYTDSIMRENIFNMAERKGDANILVPLCIEEFNTYNTVKNENLLYYIKAITTAQTDSGEYKGTITLTHDSGKIEIPMEVKVLDFALAQTPVLRSDLLYWPEFTKRIYGDKTNSEEMDGFFADIVALCRKNKLTCTNSFDAPDSYGKTPAEYVQSVKKFFSDNPTTSTYYPSIAYSDYEHRIINTEKTLPYLQALDAEGLLEKGILYSVDEPHNDTDYANLNTLGKWIEQYCPNLKNYVPILPHAIDLNKVDPGAIDIWCYAYGATSVEMLKAGQRGEKELWAYAFDKSTKRSLSQIRLMGWQSKKFDIQGIEDWCINTYTQAHENGQWVISMEAAYKFSYFFPGMEGDGIVNRDMMLQTFAVEEFRDAVEDYEYLLMLEDRVSEKINELGLDISLDEAMESYYDGCFLDVDRLPENEEDSFFIMRERIIDEIINGVPYIIKTEIDNENWITDNRNITIYSDKGSDILIDSVALKTESTDKCTIAKTYKTIGSKSKTFRINAGGKTTLQHFITKDYDKSLMVDLENPAFLAELKTANPNAVFDVIQKDGKSVLKIIFDENIGRGLTIPASALKTPVGYYNKIRCNAWTDNDENKYKPFFSMISGSAQLKSDTSDLLMSKASPITMSFDPSTAAVVGENLKRIRIDLNDRPFIEPVTIYLSDIYFFEDSNNFTWEIVE